METSLILLKPDCVAGRKVGEVIKRFEDNGFQIRGCKMFGASPEVLKDHYSHLLDKNFFPELEAFMQSTPVIALALSGNDAVNRVSEIIGPTDSRKAEKGTVRGDLGIDVMVNIVHASDSVENAEIELDRFFEPSELFTYEMSYSKEPKTKDSRPIDPTK
jgi:nucleoside-diphosphate kinase